MRSYMNLSPEVMPECQKSNQVAHTSSVPPKQYLKSALRSGGCRSVIGEVSISVPTSPPLELGESRKPSLIRNRSGGKQPGTLSLASTITEQDEGDDGNQDEDDDDVSFDQGRASYDEFSLEGISPEELRLWSKLAPEGQKLEDVSSPTQRRRNDFRVSKRT